MFAVRIKERPAERGVMTVRIDCASFTACGEREINEDRFGITRLDNDNICLALADGIGGEGMGYAAAELAVYAAEDVFRAFCGREDIIELIFEAAQKRILFEKTERRIRNTMKTTLAAAAVCGGRIYTGFIGDTRIYVYKNGSLVYKSCDHSLAGAYFKAGQISEESMNTHPDRNKLLRCLGEEWDSGSKYELGFTGVLEQGLAVLLCTDGFWGNIDDEMIKNSLRESVGAEEWLDKLGAAAGNGNREAVHDNYSAAAFIAV